MSDEWKELDLFPRRLYRKSFPLRFAVFQAWAARHDPELGDALVDALKCSGADRSHLKDVGTMIRIIDYSAKKLVQPVVRPKRKPKMVECRACGYVWEPEDPIRTHKCAMCGDWWIRML